MLIAPTCLSSSSHSRSQFLMYLNPLVLVCLVDVCSSPKIDLTDKKSSQSSNYTDGSTIFSSNRAFDGDRSACSHTLQQENSWWSIDLQGVYNISCISIYNKIADNADISGSQIYIGFSQQNNRTNNPLQVLCSPPPVFYVFLCHPYFKAFLSLVYSTADRVLHKYFGSEMNPCLFLFADVCSSQNVDLNGKKSSQSSNFANLTSDRAFDGSLSTCSHTLQQVNSWWSVDLQGVYNISSAISLFISAPPLSVLTLGCFCFPSLRVQNITGFRLNKNNVYSFSTPVLGRYVTVITPHNHHMVLCEVNITGTEVGRCDVLSHVHSAAGELIK
uniref:Fucolectin tachylectin-4 pentraxin-1 domain-containing protein n=1 Tax=Nothobranchius furzeri TaxID=105023 RepID=A0A8C6KPS0_NOTFU